MKVMVIRADGGDYNIVVDVSTSEKYLAGFQYLFQLRWEENCHDQIEKRIVKVSGRIERFKAYLKTGILSDIADDLVPYQVTEFKKDVNGGYIYILAKLVTMKRDLKKMKKEWKYLQSIDQNDIESLEKWARFDYEITEVKELI